MSIAILSILAIFSLSRAWGIHPNIFNLVSNATCQPEYVWMDNEEQQSPCLTVAYVIGACVGDTWTQPALPSGYTYDSPNGTTVTPCYCSWSCYNLMMACTVCQSPAYTNAIMTWPSFSQSCPSNYKDEIFPQGYVLASNISIPYWATVNPATWPNELFDIDQAQNYTNQSWFSFPSVPNLSYTASDHSDYWPLNSTPGSSSGSGSSGNSINVGAIIGGTIGGVTAMLLALVGGYSLYERRKYRGHHSANTAATLPSGTYTATASAHTRWLPNPSTVVLPTPTGSSMPISYGNRQMHGIGMSMPPTPYTTLRVASLPPTDTASFLTEGNTAQRTPAIPIV